MPRNPPRKTTIGSFSDESMREAVRLVTSGRSVRSVAKEKGLSFQTLARYVRKQKGNPDSIIRMTPNYSVNRVFTCELEKSLVNYLITCSRMFYGLPQKECRQVAFQLACANEVKYPETWKEHRMAGREWFIGFLRRNPELSMRIPEGCSLARATSFNEHNVKVFFKNLEKVMERSEHFADGTRIFNLDETGTCTVQKPQRVVAEKGAKHVSKVTSGEKGTLVTTCCIVSASGGTIPPAMVFPRVNFKQHMISGAPPGTLGLATKSGWMNAELFLDVIKHFIKHTRSSKVDPTLLIYDNHESHLSLAVLDLAKQNGVHILTIPPHSSDRMQPLDVAVYKAFNVAYNAAVDSWMLQHPGRPMTIYQVAACVGAAHSKALTPSNIIAGFKQCGIYPFDSHIFSETDFMSSSVTHQPLPQENADCQVTLNAVAGTSSQGNGEESQSDVVTPEILRGYPKAPSRVDTRRARRKGRSMIATDTPEKDEIEARKCRVNPVNRKRKRAVRELQLESSSDSDVESEKSLSSMDVDSPSEADDLFDVLDREPCTNDFVVVRFQPENVSRRNLVYYVGKITAGTNNLDEFRVSFLRKSRKVMGKFLYPDVEDEAQVHIRDIVMILPPPKSLGKTKRQQSHYSFDVDLSLFNIR